MSGRGIELRPLYRPYDSTGNRNNGSYSTTTGNEMSSDGTWNYAYDAEGNQTEKDKIGSNEKWTYVFDNKNRLTQARHYDNSNALVLQANYKYDVFGNRAEKSVDDDGSGPHSAVVTRFAYDGWNPAKPAPIGTENFDIWAVLDGNSSLTSRPLQGDGVDQHFGYIASSTAYWYLTNHQNSVQTVIDNNGVTKDALVYGGYGNITSETDATKRGLYAWTGREIDVETNLQYNRARYYDSATGRWISQDPMGFDAGDSNLYRYVRNRTSTADPSGYADGALGWLSGVAIDLLEGTEGGMRYIRENVGDFRNSISPPPIPGFDTVRYKTFDSLMSLIEGAASFGEAGSKWTRETLIEQDGNGSNNAAAFFTTAFTESSAFNFVIMKQRIEEGFEDYLTVLLSGGRVTPDELEERRRASGRDKAAQMEAFKGAAEKSAVGISSYYAARGKEASPFLEFVTTELLLRGSNIVHGLVGGGLRRIASPGAIVSASLRPTPWSPAHDLPGANNALLWGNRATLSAAELEAATAGYAAKLSILDRIRLRLGWDVPVPQMSQQEVCQLMGDISAVTGNEVAWLELQSGQRILRLGTEMNVSVAGARRLLAHSHPSGNLNLSMVGSNADIVALRAFGQDSTLIVGPGGETAGFASVSGEWQPIAPVPDIYWELFYVGR